MSASKVITGTLIGVAAGVAIGLLFAPDKGSETRRKISQKYNDLGDSLKEKYNDLVQGIREEVDTAKDKANEVANTANRRVPSMKGESKDPYNT